jgi:methylmalonyl-CoA/ethylmalonyl-CoA epimerase
VTAPLLSEISQAALTVDNLDRAVNFYRDTLGLKLLFRVPNMAFFECGAVRLLIGSRQVAAHAPTGAILYFKVDDMVKAHAQLQARGVRFEGPPHIVGRMPSREVWLAAFRDSENNLFHLICEKPV